MRYQDVKRWTVLVNDYKIFINTEPLLLFRKANDLLFSGWGRTDRCFNIPSTDAYTCHIVNKLCISDFLKRAEKWLRQGSWRQEQKIKHHSWSLLKSIFFRCLGWSPDESWIYNFLQPQRWHFFGFISTRSKIDRHVKGRYSQVLFANWI